MPDDEIPQKLTELTGTITHLSGDMKEMKEAIKQMAGSVNKLALIEERVANVNEATARGFVAISQLESKLATAFDKLDTRLLALELAQPITKQQQGWVVDSFKYLAGAALMFMAKQLGLF